MTTNYKIKKDIENLIVLVKKSNSIDNNKKEIIEDYLRGVQYTGAPDFTVEEVKKSQIPTIIIRMVKEIMTTEKYNVQEQFDKLIEKRK